MVMVSSEFTKAIESIVMLHIRMARVLGVETQAMTHWFADLKVKGAFCRAEGLSSTI